MIVKQKDLETIIAEMVARVQEMLPSFDATIDSDPAVKVIQAAAHPKHRTIPDCFYLRSELNNERGGQRWLTDKRGHSDRHLMRVRPFATMPLSQTKLVEQYRRFRQRPQRVTACSGQQS